MSEPVQSSELTRVTAPESSGRLILRRGEDSNTLKFDDYIPPIGPWIQASGLFMVLGFFSAIVFMAFTPYRVVVKAAGFVRPSGELSIINSPFDGRLKKIHGKHLHVLTQSILWCQAWLPSWCHLVHSFEYTKESKVWFTFLSWQSAT